MAGAPNTFLKTASMRSLQQNASHDAAAAEELARRHADEALRWTVSAKKGKHRERICETFLLGFYGKPNPYARGRGGNFASPLRRAYRVGEERAKESAEIWAEIEKGISDECERAAQFGRPVV